MYRNSKNRVANHIKNCLNSKIENNNLKQNSVYKNKKKAKIKKIAEDKIKYSELKHFDRKFFTCQNTGIKCFKKKKNEKSN